ncbi:MAG: ATP synthase F1 subunit gamma [Planctomycetes bacterium]|nr:ATP synthase F1 subunit gamma [Planctomycetota bacterium]
MAKARSILKRARAVKKIGTITSTMEMVATARFKKMHKMVVAARPYITRIRKMVSDLISRCGPGDLDHPLMHENEKLRRDVLLVITSNRGLCGSYNSSLLRLAMERYNQLRESGYDIKLHVAGKKGMQYFRFKKIRVDKYYSDLGDVPNYNRLAAVADDLMTEFLDGSISGLEIAYTQMIGAANFKPAIGQVLPLTVAAETTKEPQAKKAFRVAYDMLPSMDAILQQLLPTTVRLRVFECFLESAVTEQTSRMTAMRAASENADELLHNLTVKYNRMRQSQITTELAEILGGTAAIE